MLSTAISLRGSDNIFKSSKIATTAAVITNPLPPKGEPDATLVFCFSGHLFQDRGPKKQFNNSLFQAVFEAQSGGWDAGHGFRCVSPLAFPHGHDDVDALM